MVLWIKTGTIRIDKELTRLGVCDGFDIVRSKAAGKHRVTIFVAVSSASSIHTLLSCALHLTHVY